jgi:DNA-binding MarR family transcriptional regulator
MAKSKKVEPSKLTDHVGYWMRLVSNNVSHSFARRLDASGVTVAEWVILREMYSKTETTSPSEIAKITNLSRGAISKLISRLLDKKLVNRKESAGDRRYQDIELTDQGRALVPKLVKLADQNDEAFFSCLPAYDRRELKALLQRVAAHHQIKTVPIE